MTTLIKELMYFSEFLEVTALTHYCLHSPCVLVAHASGDRRNSGDLSQCWAASTGGLGLSQNTAFAMAENRRQRNR